MVTVKEILDKLHAKGISVRAVGGDLISRGRPGHERGPQVVSLFKELLKKHKQDPRAVERQLRVQNVVDDAELASQARQA